MLKYHESGGRVYIGTYSANQGRMQDIKNRVIHLDDIAEDFDF